MNNPTGVAVDQSTGELYAAEANNFRISKFDSEGEFLLAWGFGVADGTSQELQVCGPAATPPTKRCFGPNLSFNPGPGNIAPSAVAVDQASHDVYVADGSSKRRITKFSPSGELRFIFGPDVTASGPGNTGGLEACEPARGDVCKATSGAGLTAPNSLAFDPEGDLWIGDKERLQEMHTDGTPGAEIALPGAGDYGGEGSISGHILSLAIDSAGDFFTVKQETLESQKVTFSGLADGDTFTLGNLPAGCSAASTDPIVYLTPGRIDQTALPHGAEETRQNILDALDDACGVGSFSRPPSGSGGTLSSFTLRFEGPFAGVDEPLLSCTVQSGAGSCPVAPEDDGKLGKVEKREAGTGASIETVSEGGQPRAVALDSEDNLYLGDKTFPYRFVRFNPAGEKTSQFGAGQVIGEPQGNALAIEESAQTLYVASSESAEANSAVQAFAIPAPGPLPDLPRAEDVLPTTATLAASLNPEGNQTRYRFQYVSQADYDKDREEGGDGFQGPATEESPEQTLPGEGFDSAEVKAAIGGLIPDTAYRFRLVAVNNCDPEEPAQECELASEEESFKTPTAVGIEAQWASEVAARSATLHAELDPLHKPGVDPLEQPAAWWLEYGEGEALGHLSPEQPIASSEALLEPAVALTGLDPATAYSYRFAARARRGGVVYEVRGETQRFTTQRGGLGFELPDNRAWEMVSPAEKYGGVIDTRPLGDGHLQAAASGEALAYLSRGSIEPYPEGNRGLDESSVLSRRGPGGVWSSEDISPPHTRATVVANTGGLEYRLFSTELGRALLEPRDPTPLSPAASERTPYLRDNTSPPAYRPLVTAANALPGFGGEPSANRGGVTVEAASGDLRHVLLGSKAPLIEGAPTGALYAWDAERPAAESLRPASVLASGEVVSAEPGGSTPVFAGNHSVRHAISEDGGRAFWTRSAGSVGLYVRDLERRETVRLDEKQADAFGLGSSGPAFQGADAAGNVALFTDSRELSADASEGGRDLYRCELVEDEGGELGCALSNLTGPSVRAGETARVVGVLPGMSEDAGRAYLVAEGVLDESANGEGEVAVPGEPNLYYWGEGEGLRFVATLSDDDSRNWGSTNFRAYEVSAAASPSGRYLAFMSKLPLTDYDNRDATSGERAQEVFRYDALEDELSCVSCNPSGARPEALRPAEAPLARYFDPQKLWSGKPVAALVPEATATSPVGVSLYRPRAVQDNGRLFFNAADSLVAADSNGDGDVYQYEPHGSGDCTPASGGAGVAQALGGGGCVALISSGGPGGTAAFLDADVGGEDVFFFTPARLSVTDTDSATDVYDARVGGSAATLSLRAECQGEACQPALAVPEAPTPASAAFRGPGNAGFSSGCGASARLAQRHSRRAKALRRVARRAEGMRRSRRAMRRARRSARKARALSKRAKRCRRAARRAKR